MTRAAQARLAALPRFPLAVLPTPLTAAKALGAAVGLPGLWLKRDELIGFGFGGNKVRVLELLVADALAHNADVLVTGAGAQSNHVRATAAAAAYAGLGCVAIFWGDRPAEPQGNFALTRMLGAQCRFTSDQDRQSVDRGIDAACAALRAEGHRPYAIPRGGACALGVAGHVLAVRELQLQCEALHLEPSAVVLAAGSGGTLAGWVLGKRLFGARFRIEAVVVSRPATETRARGRTLAAEAAALIDFDLGASPDSDDDFAVHDGFIGEGYGIPTPEGLAAIRTAARTAGVFFDPTYTGKAFAGLTALAASGRFRDQGPVVFLHTGGEPALFAHAGALA